MTAPVNTAHHASPHPSVFEILSHESFASALKPAVHHVFRVLAEGNPSSSIGSFYRYFDELYLAFDAVVQWHYILTRGATLSEAFYGLERKLTTSRHQLARIRASYVLAVFGPYVSDKLEAAQKDATNESFNNESRQTEFSKFLIQYYPYLKSAVKAVNLYYLLSYAMDYSDHPSLAFKLLKMTLGYTSEEKRQFLEEKNAQLFTLSEWRILRNVPKLTLRSLGESILWIVEFGSFLIQFLEWWYSDEKRSRITTLAAKVPPAPHSLSPHQVQNFLPLLPSDIDKCPLCRSLIRNPTAISISGVVYCYSCIFPYVTDHRQCPLTRLSCNANHLIRIFR